MDDVKPQLIDEAQRLIQKLGYNGFSYRDVAAKVGIRSASIHYHFPTKADLGAAVAESYAEQFMARLEEKSAKENKPLKLLSFYASLFKEALENDNRMCLCGILGAEASSLPDAVAAETRRFFEQNLAWLSTVFAGLPKSAGIKSPDAEAALFVSTLEGALVVAKGMGDKKIFDRIAKTALARYG